VALPLVLFDHGHAGRTGGRPPAFWEGLDEARLSLAYGTAAIDRLRATGKYDATWAGSGTYRERQERAHHQGAVAFINCHCNAGASVLRDAGNPRNHTTYFDFRSGQHGRTGRLLANHLTQACSKAFPWPDTHDGRWRARESKPNHWTQNAYYLVRFAGRVPAVVFEPGFLDEPEHQSLWTPWGLEQLGHALADGIIAFLESR